MKNRVFLFLLLVFPSTVFAEDWGKYSGDLQAQFLDDGRKLRLLADYSYTDPSGHVWLSPKDCVVDGASIPQVFWSVIGGPLEGKYRNASVIHDIACDKKNMPWKKVHRAFYDAMRCSGVDVTKAKIMYFAVYHFGPRWGADQLLRNVASDWSFSNVRTTSYDLRSVPPVQQEADVKKIEAWISQQDPSLEEIEATKVNSLVVQPASGN